MSNHFPSVAADLQLVSLGYAALLPTPQIQPGSTFTYGTGTTTQLTYSAPNLGTLFTFSGTFGTFDQDAWEAAFNQAVTTVVNVLAQMSGESVAALQGQVVITRNWTFSNGTSWQALWQDRMTYP